jgi:carbon monoxide dehydrogenase subunit G
LGRIERSIENRAPPEKVWEMLAFDRMAEWIKWSGLSTSEVHNPKDKLRVGASAHATIKGEGEIHFEVTESLENTKITIHGKGGKYTKDMTLTFTLEPVEEGTKLTQRLDYELSWGIFGKFLDKLVAQRMTEKDMEIEQEKLKSILEK